MITTPSLLHYHHMHVMTIPCITRPLRYQHLSPHRSIFTTHPYCTYTVRIFSRITFAFSFTVPAHFLQFLFAFTFFGPLMTSYFLIKPLSYYPVLSLYLYPRIIADCIYINGRQSTVPLAVLNDSCCIPSHPSLTTSTVHKILFADRKSVV